MSTTFPSSSPKLAPSHVTVTMVIRILALLLFLHVSSAASPSFLVPKFHQPDASKIILLHRINSRSLNFPTTFRAGLTLDSCKDNSSCQDGRQCFESAEVNCTSTSEECFCLPKVWPYCEESDQCPSGELCADTPLLFDSICVPEEVISSSDVISEVVPLPPDGSLTLDKCADDTQCYGDRKCLYLLSDPDGQCEGRSPCHCVPSPILRCFHTPDCPDDGEVCAESPILTIPFCVSAEIEERLPSVEEVSLPNDTQGFSFDPCDRDDDCQEGLFCIEFKPRTDQIASGPCEGSGACACLAEDNIFCGPINPNQTCETGEVCAKVDSVEESPLCVSKDVVDAFMTISEFGPDAPPPPTNTTKTPTPSTSLPPTNATKTPTPSSPQSPSATGDPGTCVDARALRHLPPSDLVYSTHAIASVLCDDTDSCATGGHVVVWRGRPMMMQSYCVQVGCRRRIMQVNSPRFRQRRRVSSKTDGLEYTSFAARYETKAEEAIIATAIRFGL